MIKILRFFLPIDFNNTLCGNFWFFPTFQAVIRKHAIYPQKEITISKHNDGDNNKHSYKFVFDWQDENTCGIEVFKKVG